MKKVKMGSRNNLLFPTHVKLVYLFLYYDF